jgi:Fe-S-cluster containining protein
MERDRPRDAERRWYDAGLTFACTSCGDCCRGEGFVWVERSEIEAVAQFLDLELDAFGRRYLRRVGRKVSLVEKPNDDCVFFDEGCTIYPVRPRQCRTYPFWNRCLASRRAWAETARACEGIGEGRLYSRDEIERLRAGRGETQAPDGERR